MIKLAALLLLIGGAVHAVPALYDFLEQLTGGTPVVQIVAGAASVVVGLLLFSPRYSTVKS